ncbi:protein VAPYRIN-LIKE-like [Apium graveolens]|uniref:protein VAPYRIN-LIKE-like n=1 Tax=Apium graveolens TaxID=4045 RepID=UPI003D791B9E
MDRLVKLDIKEVNIIFNRNEICSTTFKLTNLMHTMAVAVSLTTTNPSVLSLTNPVSVLPPLSTSSFTLCLSQPLDYPPLSTPLDSLIVKSTILSTGKANQEAIQQLFSKPGLKIFKDAVVPITFVGLQVVEFLLSPSTKIDNAYVLSKAIKACDESQLCLLLRSAVKCGNCYFASTLIEAGADVNKCDLTKRSLMSLAVQSGKNDMLDLLIDSGYIVNNLVDRLLHEAAAMDRVDLMETLCLGYLDIDVNLVDLHGRTALHVAAIYGHVEVLQFLVSLGSNPDTADHHGWTPLHCASIAGHVEAAEFLLTCSVYVKYALTKEKQTAFALAVEKGHSELHDMLYLGDALQRAARIGDIHEIKRCLGEGAKVNGKDQNGWTPLHRAAFKGQTESVKVLLDHGANVDVIDNSGYTPLHRAVEAGHVAVALALIGHGAKANMKGLKGVVPLHLDSFKNHLSLVTPLCEERERA